MYSLIQSGKLTNNENRYRRFRECLGVRLADGCHNWCVSHTASSFRKRVTNIKWHPIYSDSLVAYGTFGGDIVLWDYKKNFTDCPIIRGIGMGYGSITEMRFHLENPSWIYTIAVDGKFRLQDFEGIISETIDDLKSEVTNHWYTALDISADYRLITLGDTRGNGAFRNLDGHQVITTMQGLHKKKVKHMEFCPARPWMFVTSSVDKSMKLWDIRMLKSQSMWDSKSLMEPLSIAEHFGVVSSAYFDPIFGVRLLTTSQDGEIRVYGPHNLWRHPTGVISHTHKMFQHMTDMRATWHPIYENVCVVGRYPNKDNTDQSRTIDLIDVESQERVGYFYNPELRQLIQVNQFNKSGTCLASGMGYTGLIWQQGHMEEDGAVLKSIGKGSNALPNGTYDRRSDGRPSNSSSNNTSLGIDGLVEFRKRKRSQGGSKTNNKKLKASVTATVVEKSEKKKKKKKE